MTITYTDDFEAKYSGSEFNALLKEIEYWSYLPSDECIRDEEDKEEARAYGIEEMEDGLFVYCEKHFDQCPEAAFEFAKDVAHKRLKERNADWRGF